MDENQFMYSPQGSLNPRLTSQTAYDNITDPLIRQLYFGSQGIPGFYNQLLSAGKQATCSVDVVESGAPLAKYKNFFIIVICFKF